MKKVTLLFQLELIRLKGLVYVQKLSTVNLNELLN